MNRGQEETSRTILVLKWALAAAIVGFAVVTLPLLIKADRALSAPGPGGAAGFLAQGTSPITPTPTPTVTPTPTPTPTPAPLTGTLTVSNANPRQGESITVSGSGFVRQANAAVGITIESAQATLTTLRTDATGNIRGTVTIPRATTVGAHTLRATGPAPNNRTLVLSASINVRAAENGLPKTGSGLALFFATAGSGFLVGGYFLQGWARERRASRRLGSSY